MKSINVKYFALLRDEAGVNEETLTVPCETYGELYEHLKVIHQFSLPLEMIQVAVDDEFSGINLPLKDGVRVVFIPPVAGG
ncbi:MAG: MoaD/ThiS family protein [Bacteriovoracaceae bacterium]